MSVALSSQLLSRPSPYPSLQMQMNFQLSFLSAKKREKRQLEIPLYLQATIPSDFACFLTFKTVESLQ